MRKHLNKKIAAVALGAVAVTGHRCGVRVLDDDGFG